jgi:hypothetical protein
LRLPSNVSENKNGAQGLADAAFAKAFLSVLSLLGFLTAAHRSRTDQTRAEQREGDGLRNNSWGVVGKYIASRDTSTV